MEKYHDLPMDYADATLVALAEETEPIGSSLWIKRGSPLTGCTARNPSGSPRKTTVDSKAGEMSRYSTDAKGGTKHGCPYQVHAWASEQPQQTFEPASGWNG